MLFAVKLVFAICSIVWVAMAGLSGLVAGTDSDAPGWAIWLGTALYAFGPIIVIGLIGSMLGKLHHSPRRG